MNIAILLLGVILIIVSIILLSIHGTSDEKHLNDVETMKDQREYKNVENEQDHSFEEIFDIENVNIENQKNIKKGLSYSEEKGNNKKTKDKIVYQNKKLEKDIFNEIMELSRKGMNSQQIAKKLNKGIREVDIILKIRSSKKNS
ncbi:hypothetical protein CLPU_5c01500 [Gottschalkia purinilytica]|uniref:Uncharacterized protein n=1 Tax=Gottschalkia purinilytica TaxID=1503 RepID=A0A0L0WBG9_GOTPU|nr:hypothetical protein [Gottschalkia purinilytica]KNF08843.1 hypothetical protein CLPU_5c01500 [Gottschalkia purinilytica]